MKWSRGCEQAFGPRRYQPEEELAGMMVESDLDYLGSQTAKRR